MLARGDIHWADLGLPRGSEQAGRRPVILIQANRAIERWDTIICVPCSTNLRLSTFPGCLFLPVGGSGLAQDSVALCYQVRAVDKRSIGLYINTISETLLADLEDTLLMTLGISVR